MDTFTSLLQDNQQNMLKKGLTEVNQIGQNHSLPYRNNTEVEPGLEEKKACTKKSYELPRLTPPTHPKKLAITKIRSNQFANEAQSEERIEHAAWSEEEDVYFWSEIQSLREVNLLSCDEANNYAYTSCRSLGTTISFISCASLQLDEDSIMDTNSSLSSIHSSCGLKYSRAA